MNAFSKRRQGPHLTPDEKIRQGQVVKSAQAKLGGTPAVLAFLNAHDEALGGRPIDLAVASAEGLARVEQMIATLEVAPAV